MTKTTERAAWIGGIALAAVGVGTAVYFATKPKPAPAPITNARPPLPPPSATGLPPTPKPQSFGTGITSDFWFVRLFFWNGSTWQVYFQGWVLNQLGVAPSPDDQDFNVIPKTHADTWRVEDVFSDLTLASTWKRLVYNPNTKEWSWFPENA